MVPLDPVGQPTEGELRFKLSPKAERPDIKPLPIPALGRRLESKPLFCLPMPGKTRTNRIDKAIELFRMKLQISELPGLIGAETAAKSSGHGGDPLTSVGLHFYPDLIRKDLVREAPTGSTIKGMDIGGFSSVVYDGAKIQAPIEALEATETGAYGCNPTLCSAETGDVLVKRLAAIGAGLVRDHVAKGLHD